MLVDDGDAVDFRVVAGPVLGRGMDLEFTEAAGERDLLLVRDVLFGENEQEMLEPGVVDPPEGLVVDLPQIDAADLRPDQRVSPLIVMPLLLADATACTMDPSNVCPELPTGKR